ncbi:MAG: YHYH protein [Verrucomicrobiaceae bacterium]|nr:YHYH protein [Verrucomicrobiaceae bacterium]
MNSSLLSLVILLGGQAVSAQDSTVRITVEGEKRVIEANGLPDHEPGRFPNRGNPNSISPQSYRYTVPAKPVVAGAPTKLQMQSFGIAVNGVPFDPNAAEWHDDDRTWQYEPMAGGIDLGVDKHHAHVQPTGAYHYHGLPTGLIIRLTEGKPKLVLVGWAADGFPIYGPWGLTDPQDAKSPLVKLDSSYRVKSGQRPKDSPPGKYDGTFVADYEYVAGTGDLDECNGRFGVTPEFPDGIYHYYLTDSFPFIPRLFKGTPDPSFARRGPPPGVGPPGRSKGKGKGKGRPPSLGELFRP